MKITLILSGFMSRCGSRADSHFRGREQINLYTIKLKLKKIQTNIHPSRTPNRVQLEPLTPSSPPHQH